MLFDIVLIALGGVLGVFLLWLYIICTWRRP